jgi:PAS domain S-box-containing protein
MTRPLLFDPAHPLALLRDRLLTLEQTMARAPNLDAVPQWREDLRAIAADLDTLAHPPQNAAIPVGRDRPPNAHGQSYQILSFHLENSSLAFIEWDEHCVIRHWSARAEAILGWRAEEAIGRSFTDLHLVHEEDKPAVIDLHHRILAGEQRIVHHNRNYHKDGSIRYCEWYNSSVVDEQGQVISVLSAMQDITERRTAEIALATSESRYRQLFNSANDAIFVHQLAADGQSSTFSDVNAVACRLLGYSREELMQRSPLDLNLPAMNVGIESIVNQLFCDRQALFEMVVLTKTGDPIPTEINAHLFDLDGQWTVLSVMRDIRDRKRAEQEIQRCVQKEQSLNRVVQTIRNSLDINTIFSTATREVVSLLGIERVVIVKYYPDEGYWKHVSEYRRSTDLPDTLHTMIPDDNNPFAKRLKQGDYICINQTDHITDPVNQSLANDFPGAWLIVPMMVNGSIWGALTLMKTATTYGWQPQELELAKRVTDQLAIAIQQGQLYHQAQEQLLERQRVEMALRQSLNEKDILLSEVHHRVKNNLQIISSLLDLQASRIQDAVAREALQQSQSRVASIALIHEHLYQSQDLQRINFAQYAQCLTVDLFRTYAQPQHQITLTPSIDPSLRIDMDQAISLGLILNELLANALKHGFQEGHAGTLSVSLQAVSPQELALSVGHDGSRFPDHIDIQAPQSMGLKLVSVLVKQIKGRLDIHHNDQTVFTVYFPSIS